MTELVTTKNKVGLSMAAFLGLADVTSLAFPTPDGEVGPPVGVLVFSTVCGVVTLIAVYAAWRQGNRTAFRVAAGSRILSALTALPAFFVDIAPGLVALAAVFVILTVGSVVLMMTPARRAVVVTD